MIDGCQRKFIDLALEEFPRNMNVLMNAPREAMNEFCIQGRGVAALLSARNLEKDFSGCYVLFEAGRAVYVGISRKVISRLRQHVLGTTHYDASLAYRMAAREMLLEGTRDEAMTNETFVQTFRNSQKYLRSLMCAYVAIENPLELYLFEAFCAMELDTHEWNTFLTH